MDGYYEHKWSQISNIKIAPEDEIRISSNNSEEDIQPWALAHWINSDTISPLNKVKKFNKHLEFERNKSHNEVLNILEEHYYISMFQRCSCQQEGYTDGVNSLSSWRKHIKGLLP